ncbi:DinB family protein [soil metagenome]
MNLLVEQFDLVWALASLHLDALTEDDFLWEPADVVWTVRRDEQGVWRPDWSEDELDPLPVPTIAWLTWHIDWWWSAALDHAHGRTPPDRRDVHWPGTGVAAVTEVRALAAAWRALLVGLDRDGFHRPVAYPWDTPKTLAHTASWLNIELTKNMAELGQLRLLRAGT